MDYLLDSNIILIYSRNDKVARNIEAKYQIFSGDNRLGISIVSKGEIEASILKSGLGAVRIERIRALMGRLTEFGINFDEVISRYAEIDAYSQGKIRKKAIDFSSRNMGKNDIWIAATASVFDLKLVTTDRDFDHLQDHYINLLCISLEEMKNL
jgi:tRNA(fMet)-specific endonuclease VapC